MIRGAQTQVRTFHSAWLKHYRRHAKSKEPEHFRPPVGGLRGKGVYRREEMMTAGRRPRPIGHDVDAVALD